MKKICVIGSLNMDLVVTVNQFVKPGETITGVDFGTYPGGKGANQAVALGKLGADVSMFGKLGDDTYGRQYMDNLEASGVKTSGISFEPGVSSGIAIIEVENTGQNRIILVPGANGKLDIEYIDSRMDLILANDIVLLQLEIPLEVVMYTARQLKSHGKIIILDPAPAVRLPDELLGLIDYITPNQTEIETLTGIRIESEQELKMAAIQLLNKGVGVVVAKCGSKGAYLITRDQFTHFPPYEVKVVDTTAAGDSFNAGLAYALARGDGIEQCIRFANGVGALAVTGMGAQGSMPSLAQVETLISS